MASNKGGDGRIKEVVVDSRISKVLAMRTDSVTMLESLDAISEFYVSNTVDSRRMLRQDLEMQNINLAKKFLAELTEVKNKIEDVEALSLQLNTAASNLASRVMAADENMKIFMEKASSLESRRNFFLSQSQEIQSFLSRFQLSNREIDQLYHANIDSNEEANSFFDALQRLKSAYDDCKLMVEKHCYSVGFELLESLSQHQEVAYQHLFEWVKLKCESLTQTGSIEDVGTNSKLQIAIRILKALPIYFDQCQDLLVSCRRTQLVQRFIVALTQGEPSLLSSARGSTASTSRAIELHSHDPVRYVSGMLAWMHQTVASELEFVESIFGDGNARLQPKALSTNSVAETENNRNAGIDEQVGDSSTIDGAVGTANDSLTRPSAGLSVTELVARCLQGLGRPLRTRILQTLENKAGLEMLYSLVDLLSFYEKTLDSIIPCENAVHSAVKGSLNECRRIFVISLNKQADYMMKSAAAAPLDLKASVSARECAIQSGEILRAFSSAMSPVLLDANDECHIDAVLGNILQPLLQSCRLGAQTLPQAEMAIFMLNNVSVVQTEIVEASKKSKRNYNASSWLSLLSAEAETWTAILVNEEYLRTLRRSEIDKVAELVDVFPIGLRACDQLDLSSDRMSTVLRAFYASLFSTAAPQFDRLQDPSVREKIRLRAAEKLAEVYAKVTT